MHLNPRLTHAFTEYLPPSDRPLCFFLLQSKKELFCKPMKNTKFFLGGHIITKVIFCIQICCAKVCVLENCVRSCSLPCKFELHIKPFRDMVYKSLRSHCAHRNSTMDSLGMSIAIYEIERWNCLLSKPFNNENTQHLFVLVVSCCKHTLVYYL